MLNSLRTIVFNEEVLFKHVHCMITSKLMILIIGIIEHFANNHLHNFLVNEQGPMMAFNIYLLLKNASILYCLKNRLRGSGSDCFFLSMTECSAHFLVCCSW